MTTTFKAECLYPDTNRQVAEQLFSIEVGLRELVIECLTVAAGPKWYRKLLPPDVSAKLKRGILIERASTWTQHVEHHPLYYIDFPDLSKILDTNWKSVFVTEFSDKTVLLGDLKRLEPIRNKLAHNRKLTAQDCTAVNAVLTAIESAIGSERLAGLISNCSSAEAIPDLLDALTIDVRTSLNAMLNLDPPPPLSHWPAVKGAWWFDHDYLLGHNIDSHLELAKSKADDLRAALTQAERHIARLSSQENRSPNPPEAVDLTVSIETYFALYAEFTAFPRRRGSGHIIETWLHSHDVNAAAENAFNTLSVFAKAASK